MPYKVNLTQNGSPQYDLIDIHYQTHSSREAFKSSEARQVELVDFQSEETKENEPTLWTKLALEIQYPHPEGKENVALATLKMSQASFNSLFKSIKTDDEQQLKGSKKNSVPKTSITQTSLEDDSSSIKIEIWKFEFPKEQLDLLLTDLSKSGFFDQQSRPNGQTHLSVKIDKGSLAKRWTQEPRLEDFIKRINEKGWLDSYETNMSP